MDSAEAFAGLEWPASIAPRRTSCIIFHALALFLQGCDECDHMNNIVESDTPTGKACDVASVTCIGDDREQCEEMFCHDKYRRFMDCTAQTTECTAADPDCTPEASRKTACGRRLGQFQCVAALKGMLRP